MATYDFLAEEYSISCDFGYIFAFHVSFYFFTSFFYQSLKHKIEEENRCNQEIENYLRAHQEVRAFMYYRNTLYCQF